MSYTVATLIDDALKDINVIAETDTATAEMGQHALRKLNQLMAHLRESDVDFGWYEQPDTTAIAPVPDWARLAVTELLSILLAPKYGAAVSGEFSVVLASAVDQMHRTAIKLGLDNTDMSHMPYGQGHYGEGRWRIDVDV